MALADWAKIGAFIVTGVTTFSLWLKRHNKRRYNESIEKDVDNRNAAALDKRLHDLKEEAKRNAGSK